MPIEQMLLKVLVSGASICLHLSDGMLNSVLKYFCLAKYIGFCLFFVFGYLIPTIQIFATNPNIFNYPNIQKLNNINFKYLKCCEISQKIMILITYQYGDN